MSAGLPVGFPPMSFSGGPAMSGADSHAGLSIPVSTPLVLDNSGWNVSIHSDGGTQSATGSTDANAGAGAASALTGSRNWMPYILGGLALWLLARRS
jgi:hypothetical protein